MEQKVLLQATLCFLVKDKKVLLAKKMKKIGKGFWNGYGGGIENGENPETAAIRELWEESDGIETMLEHLEKVAVLDFHNTKEDGTNFVCQVHTYLVRTWQGDAVATNEMSNPTWFNVNELPLSEMLPADKKWLPLILAGKKIQVKAWYGPHQQALLRDVEIKEVDSF